MIFHSDQGVQFTSCEFVNFCKDSTVACFHFKEGEKEEEEVDF